uniref:trypsin n=1 Tax=Oreochromis niloticus TaxID=8128 RepID=A0A669BI18_ORENI
IEAKPHSRPYMASLQYQEHHSCGGMLIREDFVLTAAHCKFENRGPSTVVLGAHDISKKEKSQQRIKVAKYYPHPKFSGKYDYDIMLLKLEKNATLNKFVKTIKLPKKNGKTPANVKCHVVGWGRTGNDLRPSNVLKEATEKTQFSSEWEKIWGSTFNFHHMICTNLCVAYLFLYLSIYRSVFYFLPQGVTAFIMKDNCNNPKYPHVFTKVNFFIAWMKEKMKEERFVARVTTQSFTG